MLCAKSWQELVFLIECLVQELEAIGSHFNASPCRIITKVPIERPTHVNVGDQMMRVLADDDFHKYQGRTTSGDPQQRGLESMHSKAFLKSRLVHQTSTFHSIALPMTVSKTATA